jgi:hypothetical protein
MPFKLNPTTGKLDFYNNSATDINYDNSVSNLVATDVQDAIDELQVEVKDQLQFILNSQVFS